MTRKLLLLTGLLAGVVVGATALLPPAVDAQASEGIPVEYVTTAGDLDTATGDGWRDVQTATVPLSSAGAAVPFADDVTVDQLRVGAVRTDRRLYLRASWADPTRDTAESSVRTFADTVAVQFPAGDGEQPPIAMGSADNPVNIWYWSAGGRTQDLVAGGPGTTSSLGDTTLSTDRAYEDGRWHVLFTRHLDPNAAAQTTIPTGSADHDVAFAVWNGSNMERSGQKAASQWQRLAVSPGPPPYQTVLWAVAGLMIVFTALVTIAGIRRTRGEA